MVLAVGGVVLVVGGVVWWVVSSSGMAGKLVKVTQRPSYATNSIFHHNR